MQCILCFGINAGVLDFRICRWQLGVVTWSITQSSSILLLALHSNLVYLTLGLGTLSLGIWFAEISLGFDISTYVWQEVVIWFCWYWFCSQYWNWKCVYVDFLSLFVNVCKHWIPNELIAANVFARFLPTPFLGREFWNYTFIQYQQSD